MSKILESEYKYGVLLQFNGVNGSIYDAIEYAYVLNKIDKTRIIICNNSNYSEDEIKNIFLNLIKRKYILDDIPVDIIILKNNTTIHKIKYKALLFMDTDIILKMYYFFADKYIVLNDYFTERFKKRIDILKLPNVYTFNEMPYFPTPVNYKFKFAFDIYKKYDKLENNTLISYKDFNGKYMHIMKLFSNDTGEEIKFEEYPINDFHSKFNRYIYNNINFFDPRCRLVIECYYYGIDLNNIIRNIKEENYDGAYHRLKDLRENGLENRYLDINDEAIQVMIE